MLGVLILTNLIRRTRRRPSKLEGLSIDWRAFVAPFFLLSPVVCSLTRSREVEKQRERCVCEFMNKFKLLTLVKCSEALPVCVLKEPRKASLDLQVRMPMATPAHRNAASGRSSPVGETC